MTVGTAMKDWEFLIQKEGDRTWLPIETQTVEILEGRYRIVVRTHRPETDVEVRIGYISTDETPPKRRVQQRTRRTNGQGLMPVVAFTRFRSGIWEVRCGLPGEGQTNWLARFELQVQPRESGDSFEWEFAEEAPAPEPVADLPAIPATIPATSPSTTTQPDTEPTAPSLVSAAEFAALTSPGDSSPVETWAPPSPIATSDMTKLRQLAEQMSQTVVDSMLEFTSGLEASQGLMANQPIDRASDDQPPMAEPLADPMAEPLDAEPLAMDSSPPLDLPLSLDLSLSLDQDTILLDRSAPQALIGQVQGPTDEVGLLPAGSLLCLELRDPATAQCISAQHRSLALQALPAAFRFDIELPQDCNSQLLLGSLQLQHQGHAGPATVLATQNFTAVAPVSALLDAVDPTLMSPPMEDLDSPEQSLRQAAAEGIVSDRLGYSRRSGPEIDTELLKLLNQAEREPQYKTSRNRVLPPKLGPKSETAANSPIDLPSFAARSIRVPTPPPFQEEGQEEQIYLLEPALIEEPADPQLETGDSLDAAALAEPPPEPLGTIDWGEERPPEAIESISTTLPDPQVDDDAGFLRPGTDLDDEAPTQAGELRSLNLEARFLDRLNAFAEEDAAQLRQESLAEAALAEEPIAEEPMAEALTTEATGLDGAADEEAGEEASTEIGESDADYPTWPGMPTEIVVDDEPIGPSALSWLQPQFQPIAIPDNMPIPEPELAIAKQELIAGQRLEVELRVAAEPTRLCAKIWLMDCQTRTLLMEPMLITDFIHGFDEVLETCVDLNVPLGCMELQIEAIAIDPISQRESHKVVLRRSVLPPDFLEEQNASML